MKNNSPWRLLFIVLLFWLCLGVAYFLLCLLSGSWDQLTGFIPVGLLMSYFILRDPLVSRFSSNDSKYLILKVVIVVLIASALCHWVASFFIREENPIRHWLATAIAISAFVIFFEIRKKKKGSFGIYTR